VEDVWIVEVAADIENQQGRRNAQPEQNPPSLPGRQQGIGGPEGDGRSAPTHRPTALHQPRRLAAVLGLDDLGDQGIPFVVAGFM